VLLNENVVVTSFLLFCNIYYLHIILANRNFAFNCGSVAVFMVCCSLWKEPCTAINEQDNKSKKAGKIKQEGWKDQARRLEKTKQEGWKDQARRLEKTKQEGWKDQARRLERPSKKAGKIKQEGWKR